MKIYDDITQTAGNTPLVRMRKAGLHEIQGIGAGFVPKILKKELLGEIITISDDAAESMPGKLPEKKVYLSGYPQALL